MNVNDPNPRQSDRGAIALGFALVAIGAILLMKTMGILWFRFSDLWPIALIAIGIEGLLSPRRNVNS